MNSPTPNRAARTSPTWYYSLDKRTSKGPVSSRQLRALAADGTLKPTSLVSTNRKKWLVASRLTGLPWSAQVQEDRFASGLPGKNYLLSETEDLWNEENQGGGWPGRASFPPNRGKGFSRSGRPDWGPVHRGLSLLHSALRFTLGGLGIHVGTILLAILVGLWIPPGDGFRVQVVQAVSLTGGIFAILALLTGSVFYFAGQGKCCAAPPNTGTRGLAIASLACNIAGTLLVLFGALVVLGGGPGWSSGREVATGALFIGIGFGCATTVLLVRFLRRVALALYNPALAQAADNFLVAFGLLMTVMILFPLLAWSLVSNTGIAFLFFLVNLACSFGFLLWLAGLVKETRDTVEANLVASK